MYTVHAVSDERLFVPISERGRSIHELGLSVRLTHIFNIAGVKLTGDLHGRWLSDFERVRNCGKKTLSEISALVRSLQIVTSEAQVAAEPAADLDALSVSWGIRNVSLKEIPISVRLAGILRTCGYEKVGDLNGVNVRDLLKIRNCGRNTIFELRELLRCAEAGEFTAQPTQNFSAALRTIVRSIDVGMRKLAARDRKIIEERFVGNRDEARTLEDVGHDFGITRERVRQVVKGACEKIRCIGGPVLARALESVTRQLETRIVPLTAPLLKHELLQAGETSDRTPAFYMCVLDHMAPSIPVWAAAITQEGADASQTDALEEALETWLRSTGDRPTAKDAFQHLRKQRGFSSLSADAFLRIVRRLRTIIVDFPQPDEPRLRLRRLRLYDVALPVLGDSTEALTPEEIMDRARSRFGADAVMLSGRSAENALSAHPDVFRLGPRSFGLRKHFVSSERDRVGLRDQFARLLKQDNRPISTIEVCDKGSIAVSIGVNSCELAEILREDPRFIDLGRRLFALATWGVEEREHIKDLLPKILSQADCPLTVSQIHERLTKFRSATPTGLTNILRQHPKIVRLDFEHYGLGAWGDSRNNFFVERRSIVERAVRRIDPPITFAGLCDVFRIPVEGPAADALWKSCVGSERLRRAPDRRGSDTLLMHKTVSLEQALASIARTLARPARAYEIEWELCERFGDLFRNVRLQQIEDRLNKSPRFLHNADGAFFLDADFDLGEFDVGAIRAAAAELMREEREILSCDDLLERLELQGFDLEGMTRGMLASILRGSERLEEVGRERFRAK